MFNSRNQIISIRSLKKCLEDGLAVIIGLQSTGEASTQSALDELIDQLLLESRGTIQAPKNLSKIKFQEIMLPSLISTCRSVMASFVHKHYPVSQPPLEPPNVPDIPATGFTDETARSEYLRLYSEAERIKILPPPQPIQELIKKRSNILEAIHALDLPPNPLDALIDGLGGSTNVRD